MQRKYNYWKIIQQNWGQGWEDLSHYNANSQGIATELTDKFKTLSGGYKVPIKLITTDLAEYKFSSPSTPTRVIFRKEKI